MIKLHTRLMWPEPTDNGTGNPAPAPAENADPAPASEESANPFDFQQYMKEDSTETPSEEPANEEPAEDYALGFTEDDGLDADDVAFFTNKAKELNLPAAGATEFVRAMGKMLAERDEAANAEAEKALRQEWGKQFDARSKQVGAYMGRVFNAMKLTREQVMEFATPAHFRVFHHIMKQNSEKTAVTAPAVLTAEQKHERSAELVRMRVRARENNDTETADKLANEINNLLGWKVY